MCSKKEETRNNIFSSTMNGTQIQEAQEDDDNDMYHVGIDAIVVALDCSSRMHVDSNKMTFLQSSIKSALEIMKRKVICSESDLVSVVLFGTRSKQNTLGHDNITVLYDLSNLAFQL